MQFLRLSDKIFSFSEAVSSPHPTVPHGSRFTFGESNANRIIVPSIEGMDDTRVELNLLDGSADNVQNSSANVPAQQNSDIVVVDLSDDNSSENKEADQRQPVAGPSTDGSVPQIMVTDTENGKNCVNCQFEWFNWISHWVSVNF